MVSSEEHDWLPNEGTSTDGNNIGSVIMLVCPIMEEGPQKPRNGLSVPCTKCMQSIDIIKVGAIYVIYSYNICRLHCLQNPQLQTKLKNQKRICVDVSVHASVCVCVCVCE
jgi:hypothetical protein